MRTRERLITILRSINGDALQWSGVKSWADRVTHVALCRDLADALEGKKPDSFDDFRKLLPSLQSDHIIELATEALAILDEDEEGKELN